MPFDCTTTSLQRSNTVLHKMLGLTRRQDSIRTFMFEAARSASIQAPTMDLALT